MTPRTKHLALNIALAGIYFIAAKFGLAFASINPSASAVWPPTGIAIAALLIAGYRVAPGIFIGAFLANITTAGSLATSLAIAAGNTLEGVFAAYLMNRFANGTRAFDRTADTIRFILLAGLASPVISATIGVPILALAGFTPTAPFGPIWFTWWLGDVGGALIVAPLIILWATLPRMRTTKAHLAEFAVMLTTAVLAALVVFEGLLAPHLPQVYPLAFLIYPPLLWATLRFGRRGTMTAMVAIAAIAIHGTLTGFGPYFRGDPNESLLLVQVFLGVTASTMLLLTVLVAERHAAGKALATKEQHFRALIEKSAEGIALLNGAGAITYLSPAVEPMLGYAPDELVGTTGADLVYPADRTEFAVAFAKATGAGGTGSVEARIKRKDGSWAWVKCVGTNLLDEPSVSAIVVNFRDVTERKEIERKKNSFLSAISSKLHTPLGEAENYLASIMANKKRFSVLEQRYLQGMSEATHKMTQLVNDLLRISRIELGTLKIEPRPTDIGKELAAALSEVLPKISTRQITVKRRYARARVQALTDPIALTSILSILLNRRAERVPRGGMMTISLEEKNGEAVITLAGTRPAESEAAQERTMDPDVNLGIEAAQMLATRLGGSVRFDVGNPEEACILTIKAMPNGNGSARGERAVRSGSLVNKS